MPDFAPFYLKQPLTKSSQSTGNKNAKYMFKSFLIGGNTFLWWDTGSSVQVLIFDWSQAEELDSLGLLQSQKSCS